MGGRAGVRAGADLLSNWRHYPILGLRFDRSPRTMASTVSKFWALRVAIKSNATTGCSGQFGGLAADMMTARLVDETTTGVGNDKTTTRYERFSGVLMRLDGPRRRRRVLPYSTCRIVSGAGGIRKINAPTAAPGRRGASARRKSARSLSWFYRCPPRSWFRRPALPSSCPRRGHQTGRTAGRGIRLYRNPARPRISKRSMPWSLGDRSNRRPRIG